MWKIDASIPRATRILVRGVGRGECVPERSLQPRYPPVVPTVAGGRARSHVIVMSRYRMRHETGTIGEKVRARNLRGRQPGRASSKSNAI